MIRVSGLAHIGVRVSDFEDSINFYLQLGFKKIRDDQEECVVVLKHPCGVEINLLDSVTFDNFGRNVLMDETLRYAGFTHMALQVKDIYQAETATRSMGIEITEGPVTFGDGSIAIFFRDPDRNVIELSQPGEMH
ncbi:VOC family protein [Thiomicrorhabdus sp. ZW0627]|uniref:VOC family protein n=1 Tax=Thiomicrorhabdus sp. ZW0627 TaxID=3039774 RepID=UPI0024370AE8|nr:VOC family protein [Thiomicrorhabdus sp. ZW0627]MDG6774833.1 VOC family protein [Thiomicrorhabdus sp. ZW0627]